MARKREILGSVEGRPVQTKATASLVRRGQLDRPHSTRIQIQDLIEGFTSSSEKLSQFAVQLVLDPAISAVTFLKSLPFREDEIEINMFLVDFVRGGRVAFDVIDERPNWDIDHEGLVQLALQQHRIPLVEIDHADIDAEPHASNCKLIWRHRDRPVPAPVEKAFTRALTAHQALSVRSLGATVGLRDPKPEISALICQGTLLADLSVPFGPDSVIRGASAPWRPAAPFLSRFSNLGKAAE